jgi:cytidylate kinase
MSVPVSQRLVERSMRRFELLAAAQAARQQKGGQPRPSRVLTISRQLGSGGRRVADALSERLGWPVWDREVLDVLASQSSRHLQGRLFNALDERAQGHVEAVLSAFLDRITTYQYEYMLPRAILTIAQHDAIIVGRGAHLYLPDSLRVRVAAPLEVRVRNLVHYDGLAEPEARRRVAASDRERDEFLDRMRRHLHHMHQRAYLAGLETEYDVLVNTGKLSVDDAAGVVLVAARSVFPMDLDAHAPVAHAPAMADATIVTPL